MTDDLEDTAIRRVLITDFADAQRPAELRRIAAALEALAAVYAALPKRHPDEWLREDWEKDLKDLEMGCDQLKRFAAELEHLAVGARTQAN